MSLDEQIAFYTAHPPSCVAAFTCTPTRLAMYELEPNPEVVNVIFALECPCGNDRFKAYARPFRDEIDADPDDPVMLPPIELECLHCNTFRVIFDNQIHGWAGVHGLEGSYVVDDPADNLYAEEIALPHQIVVHFEHATATLGDPTFSGREPDLFKSISIVARDAESGEIALLFSF